MSPAWRFTDSPFNSTPLPASAMGDRLLIGRDREVGQILRRLGTPPGCVTIEGPNGIGKTSIVNVAVYRELRRFQERVVDDQLLLPCQRSFQLEKNTVLEDFVDAVYYAVARSIIDHQAEVSRLAPDLPALASIKEWLTAPRFASVQGGVSFLNVGVSGGRQAEPNTSAGFTRSGFQALVQNWLELIYPGGRRGGVVCVLDNLELLHDSQTARERLEELRDRLLTLPGLRWVLCGAAGIVNTVLSTPRLQRVLYPPIEIKGISVAYAGQVWERRLEVYASRSDPRPPYMPLTQQGFETLAHIFHGNLGEAFAAANGYCMHVADEGPSERPRQPAELDQAFSAWLEASCQKLLQDINGHLTKRGWEVFQRAIELGGQFSPNDYTLFGCARPS